jgi:diguanylate cyclase (GGDEF)-like protein
MYLLVEGELAVYLNAIEGQPLAVIDTGEVVGELSLLDGSVASAHVVAHSHCRVLAVDEGAFSALTNDSHAFAVQLLVKLAGRLRANNTAVSESVEKRRMYERAAMFDGLTGIHNRRWLDETLHRLVQRSRRANKDLSVSLVDIDHFKSFNDTYGHDAGDHVLTVVAAALTKNVRPTDLVARFGGEEFVIIFPETTLELARVAAERVREAIAAEQLTTKDGRELSSVTISMGVSKLEPDQDVPGLLKVADLALYRAKRAGRNRVETGTSSVPES